jgi:hypothetical protein
MSSKTLTDISLGQIKSQLKSKFKATNSPSYSNALNAVNSATTVQEVQSALKNKIDFKNGKIMGGKTKKRGSKRRGGKRTMRR